MNNRLWRRGRGRNRGQSIVEFALLAGILVFVVLVAFELGRYASLALRIASTVRESGRLFVAEEIEPDRNATPADNETDLNTKINTKVYLPTMEMVQPADINAKGKMIVTILIRTDPSNNTKYGTDATSIASQTDDRIVVEYQFAYPEGAKTDFRAGWSSWLGAKNTQVPAAKIPLDTLLVGERTVMVEIYHKVDFVVPDKIMSSIKFDYIYDKALF